MIFSDNKINFSDYQFGTFICQKDFFMEFCGGSTC